MNSLGQLFNADAVILDLKAKSKKSALKEMSAYLLKGGFIKDQTIFYEALLKREAEFSTALGDGLAIPHAQNATVQRNVVLIARASAGINWAAADGKKARLFFLIALNDQDAQEQTTVLAALANLMLDEALMQKVQAAISIAAILRLLNQVAKSEPETFAPLTGKKLIVAVTACPTGIAHTYLAATALQSAASKLGYTIKVETQGRATENSLTEADVAKADGIILAIDRKIEGMSRFNGKRVLQVGTKAAIKDATSLINQALENKGDIIKNQANAEAASGELEWKAFKSVYKNLMGGVSRMLPFVVAGGILLGIAFLLDSGITGGGFGQTREVSKWFAGLGKTVFGVFIPILGGYVAYSIVGSEGLLPGFVGGLIAAGGGILYAGQLSLDSWTNLWGQLTPGVDQSVLSAGSGFIGAMVGGYLAAAIVVILRKYLFRKVKPAFTGVVSIIAMPFLSVLISGAVMFALQIPLAYFAYGLKTGLIELQKRNLLVLVGILVGAMMAADMGGPINKVAYAFGTGLLVTNEPAAYQIMAAVMIGGMVPPLSIAFSTLVFRERAFSKNDVQAGLTNWLMGAFFITEGAIPFAAKDPKRIIPTIILGSALASGIVAALQVGISAPHGGVFVFALLKSYLFSTTELQIGLGVAFTLGALLIGTVTAGLSMGFWKMRAVKRGKLVLA